MAAAITARPRKFSRESRLAAFAFVWVAVLAFGAIGGVGNCYVNIMPSKQLVIAVMGNDTGLGQGGGWSAFGSLVNSISD